MMRFDSSLQPAPYLNRRDQSRLLGMVAGLSLVVIAITWASRPQSWYWLVPPDNENAVNVEEAPLLAQSDAPPFGAGSDVPPGNNPFAPTAPQTTAPPKDSYRQIPRDWLTSINDEHIGLRSEESEAYYKILAHVKRIDERRLESDARTDILHVNLLQNPEAYLGQLVRVRGMARRIQPLKVTQNLFGIRKAYEVWITTDDSGSDLWRVVTTSIDSRIPQGKDVAVPVEVYGYFFKRFSYISEGGTRVAPMVLAATLNPRIVRKVAPSGTGLQPYILLFASLFGIGTLLLVSMYHQSDAEFRNRIAKQMPIEDEKSKEVLQEMNGQDYDPTSAIADSDADPPKSTSDLFSPKGQS